MKMFRIWRKTVNGKYNGFEEIDTDDDDDK